MDLRLEIVREIKELSKTMTKEEISKAVEEIEQKAALAFSQGKEVKAP